MTRTSNARERQRKAAAANGLSAPDPDAGHATSDCEGTGSDQSLEQRCHMIAEAAYYKALGRDLAPGQELDDWLAAEKEVDAVLLSNRIQ